MFQSWRHSYSLLKERFNGLVRADKIASGSRTPKTPGVAPHTPFSAPPTPAIADASKETADDVGLHDEYEGVALADLPFSAGVEPDKGMIGKINTEINEQFMSSDQLRNRSRRVFELPGRNVLFEYACSEASWT